MKSEKKDYRALCKEYMAQVEEQQVTIGRYEKKISDQAKELAQLKAERQAQQSGLEQLRACVDAILIRCAMDFGRAEGDGYLVDLEKPQVTELCRDFRVDAHAKDGIFHIKARRRKHAKK